jgi:branched-chain amino acid transport system substrate-binding protein
MIFDPNQKNVAPMYMGTVHNGVITYRAAAMDKSTGVQHTAGPQALSIPPQAPYARIGEDGVDYAGPRPADPPPGPLPVVLFGPRAIDVAQSQDVLAALHEGSTSGRSWKLLPVESGQNWGAASTQLVHALMDQHAVAIIALDRGSSHLSEQMALKCFVPVLAVSNDRSLTETNIPWIFRLASGTAPADALRVLERAAAHGGANPQQVRDLLASGSIVSGFAFQPTGETRPQ